jgi:hypothetical protein
MRWAVYVERVGKERGIYGFGRGKHERKRLLRRPRCRCGDNITMDLK